MILYYAAGGGLGHVVRGRAVLEALGLAGQAAIATSSPYADERVSGGIPLVRVPPLPDLDVDRTIVDTFPAGIQGELASCRSAPRLDYVARLLRWEVYRRAVPGRLPFFDTAYIVEELTPEHDAFVRAHSGNVVHLDLSAPPQPGEAEDFWLVVHSGPEEEVRELVDYTRELMALDAHPPERVLVATRCSIALEPPFEGVDALPASALFPRAARIVSAAGFNVMRETAPWQEKHSVLPFARKFDDQFLRAARRGRFSSANAPAPCAAK